MTDLGLDRLEAALVVAGDHIQNSSTPAVRLRVTDDAVLSAGIRAGVLAYLTGAPDGEVRTFSSRERADLLERLARHHADDPEEAAPYLAALLPMLAAPDLDWDHMLIAWEDYQTAVALLEGVDSGVTHWSEVAPHLTGPDRQQTAVDVAAAAAGAALDRLLAGQRSTHA